MLRLHGFKGMLLYVHHGMKVVLKNYQAGLEGYKVSSADLLIMTLYLKCIKTKIYALQECLLKKKSYLE